MAQAQIRANIIQNEIEPKCYHFIKFSDWDYIRARISISKKKKSPRIAQGHYIIHIGRRKIKKNDDNKFRNWVDTQRLLSKKNEKFLSNEKRARSDSPSLYICYITFSFVLVARENGDKGRPTSPLSSNYALAEGGYMKLERKGTRR